MSDSVSHPRREGPGDAGPTPDPALPPAHRRRRSLWLLLIPAALYCAAPLVANSIQPLIFGVPFLLAWIIAASVISPLVIWAAARLDPAYRTNAPEPIPADDPPTASGAAASTGTGPATGGAA